MNKLIFVYNADSDIFSQVKDFATKILKPEEYVCNLCAVTYGPLSMKDEWKFFLETLSEEKIFLHRDEFIKMYPNQDGVSLPAVFSLENDKINLLISSNEINSMKDVGKLIDLVKEKLKV